MNHQLIEAERYTLIVYSRLDGETVYGPDRCYGWEKPTRHVQLVCTYLFTFENEEEVTGLMAINNNTI